MRARIWRIDRRKKDGQRKSGESDPKGESAFPPEGDAPVRGGSGERSPPKGVPSLSPALGGCLKGDGPRSIGLSAFALQPNRKASVPSEAIRTGKERVPPTFPKVSFLQRALFGTGARFYPPGTNLKVKEKPRYLTPAFLGW